MIVLWGLEGDTPLAMVGEALSKMGAPLFFLDQAELRDIRFEQGGACGGALSDGVTTIALDAVRAIYLRPFDTRRLPDIAALAPGCADYAAAMAIDDTLVGWCESADVCVVNRPTAMASNNSKPYQAALIARAGFAVPDTLVTTDAQAVRAFMREHGRIIYKSCSGVRSIVSTFAADQIERLERVGHCPTQFQEYVRGTDVRVHVVGEEVFATQINSQADDYRYAARDGGSISLTALPIDDDLADRTRALTRALGLRVSGIDLRRRPDGRWVCFEVNPSPGFSFYENATGQPIAQAVARLLAHG